MKRDQADTTSQMKWIYRTILSISLFVAPSSPAMAETEKPAELEEMTVTGKEDPTDLSGMGRPLREHPGAATIISPETLETGHFTDTVEALRSVPGVHVLSEYGRGLRPNIGIRGLNPLRSSNTLILADGIPIQPAMYGAASSYYNIPVEQVNRIEVIRGGSSVLYGPNTIGGVVNYVTRRPPAEKEIRLSETVRQGGFFATELSYGDTLEETGLLLSYLNKEGETVRDNTETSVNDVTLRMTLPAGKGGELSLRFNFYREIAQTPGGFSLAEFKADPNQSVRSHDWFFGRRGSFDMRLDLPMKGGRSSETLFYLNFFERNWFIANGPDATATKNKQWLRDFMVIGIEPRLWWGSTVSGFKVHYEQQNDVQRIGTTVDARSGTTGREADLSTLALAGYVETEWKPLNRLTVTPGIRYELIKQKRNVGMRAKEVPKDTAAPNGDKIEVPGGGVGGRSDTAELTWGLGFLYDLGNTAFYASAHRTFQPPTFGQAVDPTSGTNNDLDSEAGLNYELGVRSDIGSWAHVELGLFLIDFDDQIISEAGKLVNAGETDHKGIEGAFLFDVMEELALDLNVTFLQTEAKTGTNSGKDLPMAPELKLAWGGTYEHAFSGKKLASVRLEGLYTDEQFTDAANTVAETADGKKGQLPSYVVWNLRTEYRAESWKVFAGVNNLLNEEYRERRQGFFGGIIPGGTRSVYGGVSKTF